VKDQIYAGQLDNAHARIDSLLSHRPGDAEALFLKAQWATMKDPPSPDRRGGSPDHRRQQQHEDRVPLLNRANFYVGQGEFAKARADLEAAQKIVPSDLEIALGLAKS